MLMLKDKRLHAYTEGQAQLQLDHTSKFCGKWASLAANINLIQLIIRFHPLHIIMNEADKKDEGDEEFMGDN
jgi:hypothetical protein